MRQDRGGGLRGHRVQSSLLRCREHRHEVNVQSIGTAAACTYAGVPRLSPSGAGDAGTWSACGQYALRWRAGVLNPGATPRGVGIPTRAST